MLVVRRNHSGNAVCALLRFTAHGDQSYFDRDLGPLQVEVFGLTTAAVQCTASISLEEFSASAIIETPRPRTPEIFGVELDIFFISHHHPSPNSPTNSSTTSLDSIIIRKPPTSLLPPKLIPMIRTLSASAYISSEISRYIHDIVVFLRMHRAVASGVSDAGTRGLEVERAVE
ncbi:hypothetical protein RUND412_001877 [Rhizina undulata]